MKYGLLVFLGIAVLLVVGRMPSGCSCDVTPQQSKAFHYGLLRGHLIGKGDIQGQVYLDAIERAERAEDEAEGSNRGETP